MFPFIAILFLIVPIIEIYLLIQVGQVIGAGWTILLVVLTAVIGVWLLRLQGLSTLMRAPSWQPLCCCNRRAARTTRLSSGARSRPGQCRLMAASSPRLNSIRSP